MAGLSDSEIISEAMRIRQEFGEEASEKFLSQGSGANALDPRTRACFEYEQMKKTEELVMKEIKKAERARKMKELKERSKHDKSTETSKSKRYSESESGASGPESTSQHFMSPGFLRHSPRTIVSPYLSFCFYI